MTNAQGWASAVEYGCDVSSKPREGRTALAELLDTRARVRAARAAALRQIVVQRVVPQLCEAHRGDLSARRTAPNQRRSHARASSGASSGAGAWTVEVTTLANQLLLGDTAGPRERIAKLRTRGESLESVYIDLLAATARHIEHLWRDDRVGLAEGTLAFLGLQDLLRDGAPAFEAEQDGLGMGHRIMIVAASRGGPEAGATLIGLMLARAVFRRGGWDALMESDMRAAGFADTMRRQWFDVAEVHVGVENTLETVTAGISAMRRASRNPNLGIIVCGQIFIEKPGFVRRVGADLISPDPRASLIVADAFVSTPIPSVRMPRNRHPANTRAGCSLGLGMPRKIRFT